MKLSNTLGVTALAGSLIDLDAFDDTWTPSDSSLSTNESTPVFFPPSFIPPPFAIRFGFGFSIGSAVGKAPDDVEPDAEDMPPRTLPPPPMA